MIWLVVVFILLGFRVLSTVTALVNLFGRTRLRASLPLATSPTVSVLIPARNEETTLPSLLKTLSQSAGIHEILVLDDHSTDQTAAVVKQWQKTDPRIRLLNGKPLPAGWLGKNHACYQLAAEATGELLLFVDADVRPAPTAIHATIQQLVSNNLDMVSVFPHQQMVTLGEKLTVPIMHHILQSLLPLPLVRNTRESSLAAANGQWIVIRKQVYQQLKLHETLRNQIAEDIAMARLMKQSGFRVDCLVSDGLISCRMYSGWNEALNGFTKNIRQMLGGSVTSSVILTILMTTTFPLLLISPWPWLAVADGVAILITRMAISMNSGASVWMAIWTVPILFFVQWMLVFRTLTRSGKEITWKDRPLTTGS
ncbi:MAG: glycosyltransferase [Bacteroidetes bacterium]|nr:glycosyltransferase [Bacteroidota bacterium]